MNKQKMKRFFREFHFQLPKKARERSLGNGWTISTNWHAVSSMTWCISSDLNMQIKIC